MKNVEKKFEKSELSVMARTLIGKLIFANKLKSFTFKIYVPVCPDTLALQARERGPPLACASFFFSLYLITSLPEGVVLGIFRSKF
jgi:hypothetical protein